MNGFEMVIGPKADGSLFEIGVNSDGDLLNRIAADTDENDLVGHVHNPRIYGTS